MENWEGTLSLVLIFRGCLGLMGRSEHRRLLEGVVWEANPKADGRGGMWECHSGSARAEQGSGVERRLGEQTGWPRGGTGKEHLAPSHTKTLASRNPCNASCCLLSLCDLLAG